MRLPKFLTGLLIGATFALVIWYWQKSTSAEEGALAVLDRLAAAEARVRELEAERRLAAEGYPAESPEVLSGISKLWGLQKKDEGEAGRPSGTAEAPVSQARASTAAEDDFKLITGIGPTYERRLKEAGLATYADLAAQSPDDLRAIIGLKSWQAADPEQWVSEAQERAED